MPGRGPFSNVRPMHPFDPFRHLSALHGGFLRLGFVAAFALSSFSVAAQVPHWIWSSSTNSPVRAEEVVYFRKSFHTPPLLWNAQLLVAADDEAEVFLNGVSVATCSRPEQPVRAEVSPRLHQGENVIAVRARNRSGVGGLLVRLNLGGGTNLVTDGTWLASTNLDANWTARAFNASSWPAARSLGPLGVAPWGDVLNRPAATPAERLTVPPGFRVELLRSAEPGEGSWVCLAFDERGRLFVSSASDKLPLLRVTLEDARVARVEPVPAPVHFAMGLLFAHGSLYASSLGPQGAGLYRLVDTNRNDQFDPGEMRLLKGFEGGSEHGYHALRLGPDGMIYAMNGNGTKPPQGLSARSPHRNYRGDSLSLNPDEAEEPGARALAGYVVRTDADGREWELWLGGLRNTYSFDFNPDGELFGFDSDMEWDWGTPWYRPTRVFHAVSGGDYGWREGTRLWPDYYEDSLPGAVDVGIGSPTGVKFGTSSRFPEKYRRALFAMDWSYGRILAVHLVADGASYRGTAETFLQGAPLNLTDLAFGPDGALYFVTGGRGTQSGLYRVSHVGKAEGPEEVAAKASPNDPAVQARSLRHQLERFHGRADAAAVNFLWPQLGSGDRFTRYAARIALESQLPSEWRDRALAESNPGAALTALIALARVGGPETQRDLLKSLERFPLGALSESDQLRKLRVLQLSHLRQGRFEGDVARLVLDQIDRHYPAANWPLNRELSRLLICLEAPGVVERTLDLLATAPTQEQQFHYVAQLRNLPRGWTLPSRRRFLEWWLKPRPTAHPPELVRWFADVGRTYVDGAWVDKYLREFRRDAVAGLSTQERAELASLLNTPFQKALLLPASARTLVREWTMADLLPHLGEAASGRDFARGHRAFADAQCLACHRFGNDGGAVGPELTGAGSKYDRRSLLESILEPSKVVSDQYQHTTVLLKNGDSFSGRLVRLGEDEVVLETDALSGARQRVIRSEIDTVAPAALSPMPEGLVNILSREEILDLLAYLESGGRADAPAFKPAAKSRRLD